MAYKANIRFDNFVIFKLIDEVAHNCIGKKCKKNKIIIKTTEHENKS